MRELKSFLLLVTITFVVVSVCQANLITNPGFEVTEGTHAYPNQYGDWAGDSSTMIVSNADGILPYQGSQMLKFNFTGWESHAQTAISSQIYQLIDISSYSSIVASGNAVVNASAFFNRVAYDQETDTEFYIRLFALAGSPTGFNASSNILDVVSEYIETDFYSSTWEKAEAELALPVNTDYVAICIAAKEDIHNDTYGVEFDGHYADCVSLEIVPEPATVVLLAIGGVLLGRKRK